MTLRQLFWDKSKRYLGSARHDKLRETHRPCIHRFVRTNTRMLVVASHYRDYPSSSCGQCPPTTIQRFLGYARNDKPLRERCRNERRQGPSYRRGYCQPFAHAVVCAVSSAFACVNVFSTRRLVR